MAHAAEGSAYATEPFVAYRQPLSHLSVTHIMTLFDHVFTSVSIISISDTPTFPLPSSVKTFLKYFDIIKRRGNIATHQTSYAKSTPPPKAVVPVVLQHR